MEQPYREIFFKIYQKLGENRGEIFEKLWKEQMKTGLKELPLKTEEKDILCNFPI